MDGKVKSSRSRRRKCRGMQRTYEYVKFRGMQRNTDIGLPRNSIIYVIILLSCAIVIPRNEGDEESCLLKISR